MTRLTSFACLAATALVLAGCGTPQDRCSNGVTRDLRTVDGLIRETEDNLTRGYRYETEYRDVNYGMTFCSGRANVGFCYDNWGPRTVRRAVAIDPEQEQRKLAALQDQRLRLEQAQCRPDGARIMTRA